MVWVQLVLFIIMMVVAFTMSPKTQTPVAGEVDAQGADEGKSIPVNFGSNWISMNIVWDGRSSSRPYKKKGGKK